MDSTIKVLKRIEDLYNENEVSENDILKIKESMPQVYSSWKQVVETYGEAKTIKGIESYWQNINKKTRPKSTQIAMLLKPKDTEPAVRYFNIESDLMKRDIELTRNIDCILSDYKRAVDYILSDKLIKCIGEWEYRKLTSLSAKYKVAVANGLFNDFDEIIYALKK